MGILMNHRIPPGDLCQHDNGGTVDLVMPEQVPVSQDRFHPDLAPCLAAVRQNQLTAGAAQHIAGLKDPGKLFFQLVGPPHVVRVQIGDILASCQQNAPVAALGSSEVVLVVEIDHARIRFILLHDSIRVVSGIVIYHQNLHLLDTASSDPVRGLKVHILCQNTVNRCLQRRSAVIHRNDHGNQQSGHLVHGNILRPHALRKRRGFLVCHRHTGPCRRVIILLQFPDGVLNLFFHHLRILRKKFDTLGRSLLGSFHTLCVFLLEQNLHSRGDKLKIQKKRIVLDIGQIQLQLIIGLGIVFPVYLGISGQSGLHLQPVGELRNLFLILGRNLRTLRPWPYNRHISLYDVEQLGKLVKMNLAQNSSDRRDSGIALSRKPRAALRLRVHTHVAELDDPEHSPILRQALLPVKNRAPVIQLHHGGNQQKDRRQHNRQNQTYHNIQQPLHKLLLRRKPPVAHQKKRRVKHVNLLRCHQHDVGDLRTAVTADPLLKTVFDKKIPLVRRNITYDAGLVIQNTVFNIVNAAAHRNRFLNIVLIPAGSNVLQEFLRIMLVINQDH